MGRSTLLRLELEVVADLVDPHEAGRPLFTRTLPLAGLSLAMVIVLNFLF